MNKIAVWFLCILHLCFLTGCLGGVSVTQVPGAVIKIALPAGWSLEQAFSKIEEVLLEHGYTKQPYEVRLSSQSYIKESFDFHYDPYDPPQEELRVIYLHFNESNNVVFTEQGIQEYANLSESLTKVGLETLPEDEADRENSRWAATPEMFNKNHPPPTPRDIIKSALPGLVGLLMYGLIVFLPAFLIGIKLINSLEITNNFKRVLFVVGSALLLAPVPVPLTMWGPVVLVPLPVCAPLAFVYPIQLISISIGGTAILALLVSLRIRGSRPSIPKF